MHELFLCRNPAFGRGWVHQASTLAEKGIICMHDPAKKTSWATRTKYSRQASCNSCDWLFFSTPCVFNIAGLDQKPAGLLSIYTNWPHVLHEWLQLATCMPCVHHECHMFAALHFFSFFAFFLRYLSVNTAMWHDKPTHTCMNDMVLV